MRFRRVALIVLIAVTPAVGTLSQATGDLPGSLHLARLWDAEHLPLPLPPLMRHADVVAAIAHARDRAPNLLQVEEIGRSVEGRSINHLRTGRGSLHVLLWSQMHGDEPTATAALFDLLEYLHRHREEPHVRRLLEALTLHVVPMLNPDGAERFQRRNAQGIDINRDALLLQTPEGRALKALRDRVQAPIGFNLHNQNWRTSVGRPPHPATISLLSVAYDEDLAENPGRLRTKKTCAVIRDALEPLIPGMIGRYDDEFEVRAFGDNLTKWGTSVILIETGPHPSEQPDTTLVKLNFVAILTALDALASGRVDQADPARYERLPTNESDLFHVLVQHATIAPGTGVPPFQGDVGIGASRVVRDVEGRLEAGLAARIEDLGDLRVYGALQTIDASGLTVAPLERGRVVGDEVTLPSERTGGPYIAVGQPADLMLLKPATTAGRFVVERLIEVN
jgi:Zinc carboxypeptidase